MKYMLFAEAHEKIQIETKRNNNVYHANANHTEDNVDKLRSDKVDFWTSDITNNTPLTMWTSNNRTLAYRKEELSELKEDIDKPTIIAVDFNPFLW